MMKSVADLD